MFKQLIRFIIVFFLMIIGAAFQPFCWFVADKEKCLDG